MNSVDTTSENYTVRLSDQSRDAWKEALHNPTFGYPTGSDFTQFFAQSSSIAKQMLESSPEVSVQCARLKARQIPYLYITNLPKEDSLPAAPTDGKRPRDKQSILSEAVLSGLMQQVGDIVAYQQENNGSLIQQVAPALGHETQRSSKGRADLAPHIDDSFLKYPYRPTFLALLGLINEKRTPTILYELDNILVNLARIDPRYVAELKKKKFRIRTPASFLFENPIWVDERALIEEVDGITIGGFNHTFNVEAMPDYPEAAEAYVALCGVISDMKHTEATKVVIVEGTALVFDNTRLMHARPEIESGARWLVRVYGTAFLPLLQAKARATGPAFDAGLLL